MAELTPWWPEDSLTQKCNPAALRLSCVLGMFSSLGVKVPCPT